MPYSIEKPADLKKMKAKLSKTFASVSDTAARQAIHVWNSVMKDGADEGKAWASVYAALNGRGLSKKASLHSIRNNLIRHAHTFREDRSNILNYMGRVGFMPGELKDDLGWESSRVEQNVEDQINDGSQVPPRRDNAGQELDSKGNPVKSITRVAAVDAFRTAAQVFQAKLDEAEGHIERAFERLGYVVTQCEIGHEGRTAGAWSDSAHFKGRHTVAVDLPLPMDETRYPQQVLKLAKGIVGSDLLTIRLDSQTQTWQIRGHFILS